MCDELAVAPESCRIVMPTAPVKPVTCNRGRLLNSWFDIISLHRPPEKPLEEILPLHSQEDIRETVATVTELVEAEVEALDGDHTKVFVGGFS